MAKNFNTFIPALKTVIPRRMSDEAAQDFVFAFAHGCNSCRGYMQGPNGARPNSKNSRYKWYVPAGVTQARFQLWGGGGSGAPGYCCMQGVNAGSGAFAMNIIDVTPGDAYELCFTGTENICCTDLNSTDPVSTTGNASCNFLMYGQRGPKSFVLGPGLTNFCAEGGNPGVNRCFGWAVPSENGQSPTLSPNNGLQNTCQGYWYMCNVVCRSIGDSDNDRYNKACYYGAQEGSRGEWSYIQFPATCQMATAGDACGLQSYTAYPGGLPDFWQGSEPILESSWAHSKSGVCVGNNPHSADRGPARNHPMAPCSSWIGVWGMGGQTASASTTSNLCCCGQVGGPPAIRITFS